MLVILTFEKCFAITENAEITAVGLQTLEQISVLVVREKRREAEQKQIQHNLTH